MSGAGMGHSEKLLEIAFNQRRLKAATPKLDDILGSLLLLMVGLLGLDLMFIILSAHSAISNWTHAIKII